MAAQRRMRKRLLPVWVVILAALLIVGVYLLRKAPKNSAISVLADAANSSRVVPAWSDTELAALARFTELEADGAPGALNKPELCVPAERRAVSAAQAAQDIETLFQLIENAYGAYYYFGGHPEFDQVKADILAELSRIGDAETLSPERLETLIASHLKQILSDGHFVVGNELLAMQKYAYWVPDLYFDDEISEYEDYMNLTITPEGTVKWAFTAVAASPAELPTSAIIDGKELSLDWAFMAVQWPFSPPLYKAEDMDGIPATTAHTFIASQLPNDVLPELQAAGARAKEADCAILDLRGNNGGNGQYGLAWLQGFLDELHVKEFTAQRISPPLLTYLDSDHSLYDKAYSQQLREQETPWVIQQTDGAISKNDCVLFVLIDKNIGSAGEDLLHWLSYVENVVFVGTNTSGTMICGNICEFYLPESGLRVQFGTKLNLYGEIGRGDGTGFYPDVWVEPRNAPEYLKKLLER